MEIRLIKKEEHEFLKDMLYEAIYVENEKEKPPYLIIFNDDLYRYIKNFGDFNDDICLVILEDEKLLGAAWIRKIKAYGYINEGIPELSMAIVKESQGNGYGTILLKSLLDLLKEKNYKSVSLSVDNRNIPAMKLYLKNDFKTVIKRGNTLIMKRKIN